MVRAMQDVFGEEDHNACAGVSHADVFTHALGRSDAGQATEVQANVRQNPTANRILTYVKESPAPTPARLPLTDERLEMLEDMSGAFDSSSMQEYAIEQIHANGQAAGTSGILKGLCAIVNSKDATRALRKKAQSAIELFTVGKTEPAGFFARLQELAQHFCAPLEPAACWKVGDMGYTVKTEDEKAGILSNINKHTLAVSISLVCEDTDTREAEAELWIEETDFVHKVTLTRLDDQLFASITIPLKDLPDLTQRSNLRIRF